mgnify:FL=1
MQKISMDYKETLSNLKKDLLKRLEKYVKRRKHVEGVASCMMAFSIKYDLDIEKAQIIAYLHDLTKYESITYHMKNIDQTDKDIFKNDPYYLHALSAAYIGKTHYQIHDPSILNAVTYHCTGYQDLDIYGKLLIISDVCEPNRPYENAKDIYELAFINLEEAYRRSILIKYKSHLLHNDQTHPWFDTQIFNKKGHI